MSAKVTDLPAGVADGAIFYAVNGSTDNQVTGGAANGVATLDAGGKVPAAQIPSASTTFRGDWNASTNTPTLANGAGTPGDTYIVSVAGSQNLGGGIVAYAVGDMLVYDGAAWDHYQAGAFVAPTGANPTATVGTAVVNGVASTYMRSDAAPAINPAIAPTWTAKHTFSNAGGSANPSLSIAGTVPCLEMSFTSGAVDAKKWNWLGSANYIAFRAINDAGSAASEAWGITRTAGAVTQQQWSTGGAARMTLLGANLGIGEPAPNAPLQFTSAEANRKIVLYQGANNDHQYYGFGINNNVTRYQTGGTTASHVFYAAASASASNELFRIWGTGGFLSSAAGQVVTGTDGNKLWLAKYSSGTGHSNAPTAIGATATYLQIGGREYGNNGFGGIGFSYVGAVTDNPAVWIGWEEKDTTGNTAGDFIIATRPTATNVAPTERVRVTRAGAIAVGGEANTGTTGQVLTSAGAGAPPTWATPAAGGGSTDNFGAPGTHSGGTDLTLSPTSVMVWLVDASAGGSETVAILPDALDSTPAGKVFTIKKIDASGNGISVTGGEAQIDGQASQGLTAQFQYITVIFDGTNYHTIG
jgi:hypothetical protein